MTRTEIYAGLVQHYEAQLSSMAFLLVEQLAAQARLSGAARRRFLLSAERRELLSDMAQHIVRDIDAVRAMQELETLRAVGFEPLEH